MNYSKIWRNLT